MEHLWHVVDLQLRFFMAYRSKLWLLLLEAISWQFVCNGLRLHFLPLRRLYWLKQATYILPTQLVWPWTTALSHFIEVYFAQLPISHVLHWFSNNSNLYGEQLPCRFWVASSHSKWAKSFHLQWLATIYYGFLWRMSQSSSFALAW